MLLMVFALGTTMSFAQKVIKSQASSNKVLENKLPDSKVASDLNKGNAKPTFVFLKPGGAADKVGKKSEELKGDVNADGRVNVSDVSALINMILGITPKDEERADVNGDGRVNVSDVSALINIILGIN